MLSGIYNKIVKRKVDSDIQAEQEVLDTQESQEILKNQDTLENEGSINQELEKNTTISGYIEIIHIKNISGWAYAANAEQLLFQISLNEELHTAEATLTGREDVKEALNLPHSTVGFNLELPESIQELLLEHPTSISDIKLQVNEQELPNGANLAVQSADEIAKLNSYQLGINRCPKTDSFEQVTFEGKTVEIALSIKNNFKVAVWCKQQSLIDVKQLKCFINGNYVEGRLIPSVSKASLIDNVECYDFEIPGYVWRENITRELSVFFSFCETNIPLHDLVVTESDLQFWLLNCYQNKSLNNLHNVLLALEHLHFNSGVLKIIEDEQEEFFLGLTKKYNLDGYLEERTSATKQSSTLDNPEELIIWQALKEFNTTFNEAEAEGNVANIIKNYSLTKEQRISFVKSLIPLFCRLNRFDSLRMYMTEDTVEQLQQSNNKWEISLTLPFMLEPDKIGNIAPLLVKISNAEGWLNVECIDYVISILVKDHNLGNISEVEDIIYAFLDLLDKLSIDYWSRLHDNHLISTLVNCLSQVERFNYWLKKDLVNKGIQHYAFANEFWHKLENQTLDSNTKNILSNVEKRVVFIKNNYNQKVKTNSEVQRLNTSLDFLIEFDNQEALATKKEWLVQRLTNDNPNEHNYTLSDELISFTNKRENEKLRFAASPIVANSSTVENGLLDLKTTVTSAFPSTQRTTRYELQKQGAQKLKAFTIAEDKSKSLISLTGVVNELDDWNTGFLGLDLITQSLRYFDRANLLKISERVKKLLSNSLQNTSKIDKPPLAAVNCLLNISAAIKLNRNDFKGELETLYDYCIKHIVNHFNDSSKIEELMADFQTQDSNLPHDTLVVVYSCNKYLDSRIPSIRETWLKDLSEKNIPYVILVGDGDDTIKGDVLSLNVSDTYEDLPAKTLKLFEWVYNNTAYQHVLKIDDDCYLDVDEYFSSLSYRKWHYYGRKIERSVGSMDRKWHQDKSQNTLAVNAIDKSPEPSVYADGGGAYCLSRLAIQSLLDVAETNKGKELIYSSYMEDKLVGDLLTIAGFYVSDEDYYTLIRRRLFGDALPISIWDNNFYAGVNTPTKLMHLDLASDQAVAKKHSESSLLFPQKIWPSYTEPKIGLDANQLELLSNNVQLAKGNNDVYVIAVMFNEMVILPHFLTYYRGLGVSCFIIADNASTDGTREYLLKQSDVIVYSADTQYKKSHYGVAWQQTMLANHCSGKWALVVDADEFILYPDSESNSLASYTQSLELSGYDSVCIYMIDTYPYGDLNDADLTKSSPFEVANYFDAKPIQPLYLGRGYYSNTTGHTSSLRHRLAPQSCPDLYTSQKFSLFKYMPWMKLSEGLHYVANITPAPEPIAFAHFKYHAAFKEKIETEVKRKQHYGDAQEYIKYQELLAELDGHFGSQDYSLTFSNSDDLLKELPKTIEE